MLKNLGTWLDSRTGYKHLVHEALEEPIPGGARWRYVFGSALSGTFMIQLVTGVLLMTSYSPSSSTAWGSVWYITYKMDWGWFIRGLHHFGSQAMVILLLLHMVQVVLAGAYRGPREVNWWFGMLLLFVTLGFSLTGYLLPWDQKGFWATKVATKIASGAPGIGPAIEKVVVGGDDYGNQTLTRFYGLHVGVLPALLVLFLVGHIALFRKHGVTAPAKAQGSEKFWPKQVFYDTVATVVVFGVLAYFAWKEGAPLDAPADPGSSNYPARPEWYFLSLFQLLKKFDGRYEFVGTQVVPGAIVLVLLLMPLFDKLLPRRFAHFLACMFVFSLVGGAGYLTIEAFREDARDPSFVAGRKLADDATKRALMLAKDRRGGIPPTGAGDLLNHDPLTRGMAILEQKCLGCHSYEGKTQAGPDAPMRGFDLAHFASNEWIREFLADPSHPKFTARVPTAPGAKTSKRLDGMVKWQESRGIDDKNELDQIVSFVARLGEIPADVTVEEWAANPNLKNQWGYKIFVENCLQCHTAGNLGSRGKEVSAPSLFAYGSPQWLAKMIKNPETKGYYAFLKSHERMPGFADQLTPNDLEMVIRLLRDDFIGMPEKFTPQGGRGRVYTAD
ncbi:MAG: cytochrome b subunit of the bc complex [Planctomycetota bacterium]|nr:cytochrome b subunit of the bc complex [Planctomycetota bacterium]